MVGGESKQGSAVGLQGMGGYPFGKERGINKNRGKDRSQKNSGEKEQQRQVVYNFINKANSSFEIAF